ncbi:MAG: Carboxyvinyl-carboxyphosphonate phosphorylmutase, partial [uncultured Thermomicrobiales bacterium]
ERLCATRRAMSATAPRRRIRPAQRLGCRQHPHAGGGQPHHCYDKYRGRLELQTPRCSSLPARGAVCRRRAGERGYRGGRWCCGERVQKHPRWREERARAERMGDARARPVALL